ncbi:MAG: glycerophosphodiester phosphodiesterase family protein [Treponemataceae bacterium]
MSRVPLLPDFPRPLVFAHRGCSSLAPENTMASFRLAREYGAPGLELDIHRCASGELVVIHDANFLRTTGVDLRVEDATYERIKELDAGKGERIPLLSDVLDEFSDALYIDIELKTKKTNNDPLPEAFAHLLHDRVQSSKGVERRIVVSSFNPLALATFKRAAPEYATAVIWSDDGELPFYLRSGQGRWLSSCDYLKPIKKKATLFSLAFLSRLGGRPLVPWVVDDPAEARRLVSIGCTGIITNRPQDLVPGVLG